VLLHTDAWDRRAAIAAWRPKLNQPDDCSTAGLTWVCLCLCLSVYARPGLSLAAKAYAGVTIAGVTAGVTTGDCHGQH
jgi:hypothetical protein